MGYGNETQTIDFRGYLRLLIRKDGDMEMAWRIGNGDETQTIGVVWEV